MGDARFVFVFPGLYFFDELFAAVLSVGFEFFVVFEGGFAFHLEAFIDDGLSGDAGVVGAGNPYGVVAKHAMVARLDILEGVVKGVAHVEGGGDVGRWDDDGVGGSGRVRLGMEGVGLCPLLGDLGLHRLRVISLVLIVSHGCAPVCVMNGAGYFNGFEAIEELAPPVSSFLPKINR